MTTKFIKNGISGIYGIKCLANNKIYIGSSKNIKLRLINHSCDLRNKRHCNTHLQNSYNVYGENEFEFIVLETVSDLKDLPIRENYYMNLFESLDRSKGFNLITETEIRQHSDESKQKMSRARKGRRVPLKTRKKMQAVWTEERRRNHSEKLKGKIVSLETREKLSKASKGKKRGQAFSDNCKKIWTDKKKQELSKFFSRPILKLSLNKEIIARYESIGEASRDIGNTTTLTLACKDGKPHYGFLWMYASSKLKLT